MKFGDEAWTPKKLIEAIEEVEDVRFTLDVAATRENTLCERFYSKEENGLKQPWTGVVWCNPPYSKGNIAQWVKKAISELDRDGGPEMTMMLLPSDTSTAWFHDMVWMRAEDVTFLKGRIAFEGPEKGRVGAPFPSMLVKFLRGGDNIGAPSCFSWAWKEVLERDEDSSGTLQKP